MKKIYGFALAAVLPVASIADTDAYGNEIRYGDDGTTVTYRFWVSGDKAETATTVRSNTKSFVFTDWLESRARTSLSDFLTIVTRPWSGLSVIVR